MCALLTTFTGGSGITVIALGGPIYPILKENGYPEGFSLGLVAAAGSLGLLFPRSLPVVLYSVSPAAAAARATRVQAQDGGDCWAAGSSRRSYKLHQNMP